MNSITLKYNMGNPDNQISFFYTPTLENLPVTISSFGKFRCDNDYFTEREGLDQYLLIHTCSGCGYLNYRGKDLTLSPGSTILINCREYQKYGTQKNNLWEFFYFHFSGNAADSLEYIINDNSIKIITFPEENIILDTYHNLENVSSISGKKMDLKVSMLMYTLLTQIALAKNSENDSQRIEKYSKDINRVIKKMQNCYMDSISIDELAAICHMSKYHFIRTFNHIAGQTPHKFLLTVRINRAKELLHNSDFSVSNIANLVGFTDPNSFIRAFKLRTRVTPLQFRIKNTFPF